MVLLESWLKGKKIKGRVNPSGEQHLWNLEKVDGNTKICLDVEFEAFSWREERKKEVEILKEE